MTSSPITTTPAVPVDASDEPWAITDEDAAILRHDFGDGRLLEYWLPRRAIPVDFDGNQATINVDPVEVVRWATFVDHVKADVVFSGKPDALLLWFALNLEGVTAVEESGRVDLVDDETGLVVGVLPAPFLLDADRIRHDCAWRLGTGYVECDLPDLDASLYLGAVFDPTTIDTGTATTPTAFSNQKKLLRLSTGRLVAIFASTSTNAEVWSSTDNGATWGQYSGADIAGWTNGSIDAYVDSGGTERLVAAWKQSGAGGSRTSGRVYVMVGHFSSDRATLTWGTAAEPWGAGAFGTDANYPDVVAHAEGGSTGGYCHVVLSYSSGSEVRRYTQSIPITADTLSATAVGGASGSYGTSGHTYPSISINRATKDLYVAWSGVTTGAGQGIRFAKDTYGAGTWARGTEREIDNACYVDGANRWIKCVYDAGRSVAEIGGYVLIGGNVQQILHQRDAGDTTTTARVVAGPNGTGAGCFSAGSFAINPATGDVHWVGQDPTATNNLIKAKWTRATTTQGSSSTLDSTLAGIAYPWASAVADTLRAEAVYSTAASSPFNVRYVEVQSFNTAPTAATWVTSSGAKDVPTSLPLDWAFNDPDAGDTQSAFALKRDIGGTVRWWNGTDWSSTTEVWNTSVATIVTLSSGWAAGGDAERSYYVNTKDAVGAEGSYSAALLITPSSKVNPTLDEPDDGDAIGTSTLDATWTVAEQSAYKVRLLSAADAELWTTGWVPDPAARIRTIAFTLLDNTSYKVELTTKNAEGLESNVVTNDIDVDYTGPATPTLATSTTSHKTRLVTITNPAPGGGQPAVTENRLWRRRVGDTSDGERIAVELGEDAAFDDVVVGHLEEWEYRVEARAANGTATFGAWTD